MKQLRAEVIILVIASDDDGEGTRSESSVEGTLMFTSDQLADGNRVRDDFLHVLHTLKADVAKS